MCGLTGFARHPDSSKNHLARSKAILRELLIENESRGIHATGLAVCGGREQFVWKWAVKPTQICSTKAFHDRLDAIGTDTTVVIGHTRWATLPNAHVDEAAHPYVVGDLVGAHNGIIQNWRAIAKEYEVDSGDWLTDSQAALYLLDRFHDAPKKAFKELQGDWALTWFRDGKLNIERNLGRPLAAAYDQRSRTLYWSSERRHLVAVLNKHGIKDAEFWDVADSVVYSYTPQQFDHKGTNVVRANMPKPKALPKPKQADLWRSALDEDPYRNWPASAKTKGEDTITTKVRNLHKRVKDLETDNAQLRADLDYVLQVLAEVAPQYEPPRQCVACGEQYDADDMLEHPEGWIHEGCIFTDDRTAKAAC